MRTLTIPDLHGRSGWQQLDLEPYDKVVFTGDYVDSYEFPDEVIYANLQAVIALKEQNPDRVELLLGNHDIQYFYYPDFRCSGFRPSAQPALTAFFQEHQALFNVAFGEGCYLWTHAGLSAGWHQLALPHLQPLLPETATEPAVALAAALNKLAITDTGRQLLHQVGVSRGGFAAFGGVTWADQTETVGNHLPGFHQLVGHTPVRQITRFGGDQSSITYLDCLQTQEDYLRLEV